MLDSLEISLKNNILNKEEGKHLSMAWSPICEILRDQSLLLKYLLLLLATLSWPG